MRMPIVLTALWTATTVLTAAAQETPREAAAETPKPAAAQEAVPCGGGSVRDDGTVETGYGFVPSAKYGIYVQELRSTDLPDRRLGKVCVCWLKTRSENVADFEVLFYKDAGGRPAEEPYASVPSRAADIPKSVKEAGRFYEVDVAGVEVPEGSSYVGVRWDPSAAPYLFTCTDTSEATAKVPVFFREDRQRGWASVFQAKDPIFRPHRAILVRAAADGEKRPPAPGLKLLPLRTASAPPSIERQ